MRSSLISPRRRVARVLAPNGVQLDRSSGPDGCYDLSGYADAITIWTTPNSRERLPGYGDACVDAGAIRIGRNLAVRKPCGDGGAGGRSRLMSRSAGVRQRGWLFQA
jgi:hypothetical protein